ncbi:MAG: ComF family protein [Chromatiales bacterium]|nr:ComF family protein [Chromatiales bacterium]
MQRLKFSADLAAARALGHGLALAAARLVWDAAPCVVAMPAHWTRLLRRGFNPAAEIARWVARERAWPVDGRLLRRRRGGPAQSSAADEAARRRNVRGAFVAARRRQVPAHVALVDDVVTTGATVDAAARALQSVGVQRVTVLAATRAGRGQ